LRLSFSRRQDDLGDRRRLMPELISVVRRQGDLRCSGVVPQGDLRCSGVLRREEDRLEGRLSGL